MGYQIDEITYAKGGGTLNAYICAQGGKGVGGGVGGGGGGVGRIKKSIIRSAHTKWMAPIKCHGILFVHWSGHVP